MSKVSCTANWKDKESGEEKSREISVEYDFGEDVNSMISELGADAVYQHAKSSITVALQSFLRSCMQADFTDEVIRGEKLENWEVPSGRSRTVNRLAKLKEAYLKLSPEDREELLAAE